MYVIVEKNQCGRCVSWMRTCGSLYVGRWADEVGCGILDARATS